MAEVQLGLYVEPAAMTVGEYHEQWRATVVDPRLRPQTVVAYRSAIRTHLAPTLGHPQLGSVTAMHVDRLYASLLKGGLNPTTLLKTHTILTSAFRRARRWRLIADNSMEDVAAPRRAVHETRVLTAGEMAGSIARMDGRRDQMAVVLSGTLGVRRHEGLALRWSDIDWDAGEVQISRGVIELPGQPPALDDLKTATSRRWLPVPNYTLAHLRQHRKAQLEHRLRAGGAYTDLGLVVCDEDGSIARPSRLTIRFKYRAQRLGYPDLHFHCLRHSYGSNLLALGVDLATVSRLMGHSNPAITVRVYAHMLTGQNQVAAARLDEPSAATRRQLGGPREAGPAPSAAR